MVEELKLFLACNQMFLNRKFGVHYSPIFLKTRLYLVGLSRSSNNLQSIYRLHALRYLLLFSRKKIAKILKVPCYI